MEETTEVQLYSLDKSPTPVPIVGSPSVVMLYDEFESAFRSLLLALMIARPGAVQASIGSLLIDGHLSGAVRGFCTFAPEALETAVKTGWPVVRQLPLVTVWRWLERIDGFSDYKSGSAIGRAIAALSHTILDSMDEHVTPMIAVWPLLGLEALFCSQGQGLVDQLIGKVEALIGKPTGYKKALKKAYSFRSKFIHGSMNMTFRHVPQDWMNDPVVEAYDEHCLLLAVLVSSIQELCARDLTDIRFSYSVDASA